MSLYDSIDIYLDQQEQRDIRTPNVGMDYISPLSLEFTGMMDRQKELEAQRKDKKMVLWDVVGSGLWSLLDEGTFGVAGALLPSADEYFMPTTGAGKIAAGIGGTVGFIKGAPLKVGAKIAQKVASPFIKKAGFETKYDAKGKVHKGVKITKEGVLYSEITREYEALKNIQDAHIKAGLSTPKEIIEQIAKIENDAALSSDVNGEFLAQVKDYNEKLLKMDEISKLPLKEQVKARADIIRETGKVNLLLNEMYREMQQNKDLAYEMYANDFNKNIKPGEASRKLTDSEKAQIDIMVDSKVNDMRDVNSMLNGTALNNGDSFRKTLTISYIEPKDNVQKLNKYYGNPRKDRIIDIKNEREQEYVH